VIDPSTLTKSTNNAFSGSKVTARRAKPSSSSWQPTPFISAAKRSQAARRSSASFSSISMTSDAGSTPASFTCMAAKGANPGSSIVCAETLTLSFLGAPPAPSWRSALRTTQRSSSAIIR